jgi:hypothetical protein
MIWRNFLSNNLNGFEEVYCRCFKILSTVASVGEFNISLITLSNKPLFDNSIYKYAATKCSYSNVF